MTGASPLKAYDVPASLLEAIASGTSDTAELERLRSAERSMQMLLLRSLLEQAEQLPPDVLHGRLQAPAGAWLMMAEAQKQSPSAVETIVSDPFVRTWAARLLRRLEENRQADRVGNDGPRDAAEPPLWVDFGQFHCLAAAVAVRAGITAVVRLPTSRGRVWLPTLGVAGPLDDGPWGISEVQCSADGIVFRGSKATVEMTWHGAAPPPQWQPVIEVPIKSPPSEDAGVLRLDAVTPCRDFGSVLLPAASAAETADTWRTRLADASELLERQLPKAHKAFTALVTTVVPLPSPSTDPMAVASASSPDAFGAMALSLPPDRAQAAAALTHEARHQQLNALLALVPLVTDLDGDGLQQDAPVHYAPWRSDPRPILGLLHGTFAFAGVADFWRTIRRGATEGPEAARAHFEFALLREQVREGARTLAATGRLTPPGETFVAALTRTVDGWLGEEVPGLPAALARQVCTGRRAMWRMRHLVLDDAGSRVLADAWRSGVVGSQPVRVLPRPRPELVRPDARGALSRLFLSRPDEFTAYRRAARGETAAQMAVIAGEPAEAERWFRRRIAQRPEETEAWVGWATATEEHDRPPAARFLLERPELVAGVHRALETSGDDSPDPLALAGWLAESGARFG
ncbi:HEXXH motif domain-containing protein [Streptomyces phaeochromogenes]|uniref:HEXXH motif domain-containing protein n=1 Tax=Streptomyces phaeochromogenes TaxID=1923 RepID=UPI0036C08C6E